MKLSVCELKFENISIQILLLLLNIIISMSHINLKASNSPSVNWR